MCKIFPLLKGSGRGYVVELFPALRKKPGARSSQRKSAEYAKNCCDLRGCRGGRQSGRPWATTWIALCLNFSFLHHVVALAQERGNVEIVLLEVCDDGAAQIVSHGVKRNHVSSQVIGGL